MTRARTILAVAALPLLALAGCDESDGFDRQSQVGPNPVLPEQQQSLLPSLHIAGSVSWRDGETPVVPQGLKIAPFAAGLASPRSIYVLPNGDVLVAESSAPPFTSTRRPKDLVMKWVMSFAHGGAKGANRITLLRDTKGTGTPDVRSVFLDHLNSPFGMVLVGQDFYVANTDGIVRYPYETGATSITAPGTRLTELPGGPIDHHWTKSLTASPDGTLLYAGVGSNSNITENGLEAEKGRAAIWEIDRASGRSRLFAEGLRNPNGLQFEPQSHVLWAVVNERDELGPNLVPDYLTSVKEGAFYGWPYSYFGQHVDPRVMPQRPDLVARAIAPDYGLSSHVAPLGMVFYTGDNLPAQYRGGAFVGEHGSWNRKTFNGYKVVYVPFANGRPNGKAQDVVTGFLAGDGKAHGRPVGLAVDKGGGLLIADDLGGAVWRVTGGP